MIATTLGNTVNPGGNQIAILASGDITDFGYSYTVNAGRIKMERALNISGSLFAPNINDQDSALALIHQLVAEGYLLIISTTTAHANAPIIAAGQYPHVAFVMSGGTSTLPNLSSLNWSGPDQYYAAGVFAGAISTAKKVGFIHPGPPLASVGTLNAFYVGVKSVNPDCDVFSVYTNSYLNPDRTTGACKILLAKGVDMLVGQQDDLTLQNIAMTQGFLAVGTNGFSLRDIFGETVGVSVIRNWGGPFTTYAQNILYKNISRQDISGAFSTGYTTLDTPSHLVPENVWENVQAGVQLLLNKTKPYFCSPFVSEMGLGPNGCLLNTSVFTVPRLSGIKFLGTYLVPLENVKFPSHARVGIITVSSILYVLAVVIAIAILVFRRDTVMLAASPVFLGLVLIGAALCFTAAITWVSEPNIHVCAARIWLPSIGFTLCIGAMIIKNVRLVIIFDAQLRRVKIRDRRLLTYIGVLLLVDVVLLVLYTALGDPSVQQLQGVEGLGTYQVRNICHTKHIGFRFLYAIISFHLAQLLVGCIVTFKIRVIDIEEFNESRPFGLCIYIASLVVTIAGILLGTGGTTHVQATIIISLSLLIGACAVLVLLFAPKFLTIMLKGSRGLEEFLSSTVQQRQKRSDSSGKGSNTHSSGTDKTSGNDVVPI